MEGFMATVWSAFTPRHAGLPTKGGRPASLVVSCALLVLPPILLAAYLPPALVLPMYGLFCVAAAAAFTLIACWRGDRHDAPFVTWWDVAGAFAFIGCAAVLLSDPEDVLPLLGHP
jgi:hypothetical protein